jgi:hypothetical protein
LARVDGDWLIAGAISVFQDGTVCIRLIRHSGQSLGDCGIPVLAYRASMSARALYL